MDETNSRHNLELQDSPEIERLSKELFFHFVNPRTYAVTVAQDIIGGMGLMGIAGRATLRRGFPDSYGPNLVFRVPESSQQSLFTSSLDPVADPGLTSGRDSIFALLQGFNGSITSHQEEMILRWLRSPHRSATMDRLSQEPISSISNMVRYLDSKYFVGLYDIEEDEGRKDILKAERLIHPFVQNVQCILSNPSNPLDNNLVELGINYYIRHNPRNKV